MKRILATMACLFIVCVGSLASHDFWLIPNAFRIVPGTEVIVFGQTSSTFPTTLSAVTPDRIARARLVGAQASEDIQQLDVSATSLRLVHRPRLRGQALVTAMLHPRSILESPESFRRYLELEGAPEALARYEREGLLPTDSITRRYAKYAKTLIEVGEAGLPVYQRIAGHPLEFVPLDDPARISTGDSLRFQMLLFGKPVPEARGHASVAGSLDADAAYHDVSFETDAEGAFVLRIDGTGIWNVRALYILPAPTGSGADWDVHWATFVWHTAK